MSSNSRWNRIFREEKKEGKEKREDKTKDVFGRSNFECEALF
jgi:hypothetical protein